MQLMLLFCVALCLGFATCASKHCSSEYASFHETHVGIMTAKLTGFRDSITVVSFNHRGNLLGIGGRDHKVYLYTVHSMRNFTVSQKLTQPGRPVSTLDFSRDGMLLAVGSWDMNLYVYHMFEGQAILHQAIPQHKMIASLHFSPDSRFLAMGTWDDTVFVYHTSHGDVTLLHTFGNEAEGAETEQFPTVQFHPGGDLLVVGAGDRRQWSPEHQRTLLFLYRVYPVPSPISIQAFA